jgi:hypothetical protein
LEVSYKRTIFVIEAGEKPTRFKSNKTMTFSQAAEKNAFIIDESKKTISQFNTNLNQWESTGWAEAGVRCSDGEQDEDDMIYNDAVICMEDRSDEFDHPLTFINANEISEAGK